jgi:methionine sulfoxide reductase heme-binding subunit
MVHRLSQNWHRIAVHGIGILLLLGIVSDYLQNDSLINRTLMLRAGSVGLIFLVASFACTPINVIFGWPKIIQVRRSLGLYSVLFIAIHLVVYAVLDNYLDLELIVRDIGERRAMLVGLAGFVLLLPLAATSTRGWQRRLGKRWRLLHALVYVAVPLAVLHYLWLDRDIINVPILFAVVVGLLLLIRLPPIRDLVRQSRLWLRARHARKPVAS